MYQAKETNTQKRSDSKLYMVMQPKTILHEKYELSSLVMQPACG